MYISKYLEKKIYPGRVLIAGMDGGGLPFILYAIMGRSERSRNRVFALEGGKLKTKYFDKSMDKDELIIYSAKQFIDDGILVGNGNHVSELAENLQAGYEMEQALCFVEPEPDAPIYTPRITLFYNLRTNEYSLSLVKKDGDEISRTLWKYKAVPGLAHVLHTYDDDGNPLPSFSGNPVFLDVDSPQSVWEGLNYDNKVALYYYNGNVERLWNKKEEV